MPSGLSKKAAVLILLALTLAMFGDVLFTPGDAVLSKKGEDLYHQDVYWREFGFSQLRQGNFALWNPHIFSGAVFFGGFQSGLLYPLNWHYLFLPLTRAINVGIALHVFLAGLFMFLWASRRGLDPLAALVAAVLFMFCGPYFLHIYPGHLGRLCAMVWAPLIFLAIDGVFDERRFGYCLLGMFAVAMQWLAGDPQYGYYTGIAAAVYSALRLARPRQRWVVVLELLVLFAGGFALAAVEVMTGLQATGESVRGGGVPYGFASTLSFPPENLVTLIAPYFFGDMTDLPYWGRCYLWEMTPFIGVIGIALAVYGVFCRSERPRRALIIMVLALLVLALGAYTPLFRLLYDFFPGFNKFRGCSKFIFQMSLFLTLLAGIGFDHLVRNRRAPNRLIIAALVAMVLLGGAGLYIQHAAAGREAWWHRLTLAISTTKESYLSATTYGNPGFARETGLMAGGSLILSAGILLLFCAGLISTRLSSKMIYGVAFLAAGEMFLFGRTTRPTFPLSATRVPGLAEFAREHSGDYRILCLGRPNAAMSTGLQDISGYGPVVLRRYAEFMAFTQGRNPYEASQYLPFENFHPLYGMLRCKYLLSPTGKDLRVVEKGPILPRVLLVQDYRVISDRDRIFAAMSAADFDPAQVVILERAPAPAPEKTSAARSSQRSAASQSRKGSAKVLHASTDYLAIQAVTPRPAILLITDAYSEGWHARALPGSDQKTYQIMPANYVLRAIPLSAGRHLIRLEYLPAAYRIGKWVSIISLLAFVAGAALYWSNKPSAFSHQPRTTHSSAAS